MKDKKKLIIVIIAVIGLIVITVGTTYAFFNYIKKGTTENTVTTGTITFLYTEVSEVGRGISITDALPISDEQGKLQTGEGNVFDFKVTSTTPNKVNIPYEVTARKKSTSTLDEDAVKIYLTEVDGTEEEILLDNYSNLDTTSVKIPEGVVEKTIYKGSVPSNSTNYEKNFRLRMWVDESVDFSPITDEEGNDTYPYNGKTFTVTVNVYANGTVITEEDIANESKAEIVSLKVADTEITKVENKDYDYEMTLPEGTTEATIDVETIGPNSTVKVEKIDSLAYSETKVSVKRLSTKKKLELDSGDNYFKITVTSADNKVENEYKLKVYVGTLYKETLLNRADPILKDNLVPVVISDTGVVTKADISSKWYSYEEKMWANAVILKDESISYKSNQEIPEDNIESYFVWIPKYSYQIFDLGNYNSITSVTNKEQEIKIKFGLTNTSDTNSNECTTPMSEDGTQGLAGESGNCKIGDYMTHPAFITFNTNGIWVGKFETGYDGATTTEEAEQNAVDTSKIIIKPNVYSWRGITLGNAFKNSYDYNRNLDSHMMKNTEWGAVAYLSHSLYGINTEVRVNNNSNNITGYAGITSPTVGNSTTSIEGNRFEGTALGTDGTYTVNYLNSLSDVASTTGNKSGVYDMSGGSWEYVMGYTTGATTVGGTSGITSLHSDFFTNSNWNKYYDKYSSTNYTDYNNRILGDATGEIGPFGNEKDPSGITTPTSSWYRDYSPFAWSSFPWFQRGGYFRNGSLTGTFAFYRNTGSTTTYISFRIVLA